MDSVPVFVLGLYHTISNAKYTTCAYTQKTRTLCKMIKLCGDKYRVIFIGNPGAEVVADEKVDVLADVKVGDMSLFEFVWGHPGGRYYEHPDTSQPRRKFKEMYHAATRNAIAERLKGVPLHGAILTAPWGYGNYESVRQFMGQYPVVETGIGYQDTFAPYRIFESYAWMHMRLGADKRFGGNAWPEWVVPNAYDVKDWTFTEKTDARHMLYFGRLNADKGVILAMQAAKAAGVPLRLYGQCDTDPRQKFKEHLWSGCEFRNPVEGAERSGVLGNALGVYVPTYYVEPFGGVAVEAMLCGTPVITTDWGVFPETVVQGVVGYRCRSFNQFVWATKHIGEIDRSACRKWAAANYSIERVAQMYDEAFSYILQFSKAYQRTTYGFYAEDDARTQINFLRKQYQPDGTDLAQWSPVQMPPLAQTPCPTGEKGEPGVPGDAIAMERWKEANRGEAQWWLSGTPSDVDEREKGEQKKQEFQAAAIGLPKPFASPLQPLACKSVIDVGGGPCSLLLGYDISGVESFVMDPLDIGASAHARYCDRGISRINRMAEECYEFFDYEAGSVKPKRFDEVWIYNVLQHVHDPRQVLENVWKLAADGGRVRLFEYLDVGTDKLHLHTITREAIESWLAWCERESPGRVHTGCVYGKTPWDNTRYVACVVTKKGTDDGTGR